MSGGGLPPRTHRYEETAPTDTSLRVLQTARRVTRDGTTLGVAGTVPSVLGPAHCRISRSEMARATAAATDETSSFFSSLRW